MIDDMHIGVVSSAGPDEVLSKINDYFLIITSISQLVFRLIANSRRTVWLRLTGHPIFSGQLSDSINSSPNIERDSPSRKVAKFTLRKKDGTG